MTDSEKLDLILKKIDQLMLGGAVKHVSSPAQGSDDRDLDSEYGDPFVKKDPKRWDGNPIAPCKMSEGTAEWLDVVASFYEWQAGKDEEQGKTYTNKRGEQVPTAPLRRKDAARARGWARRLRGGWTPPGVAAAPEGATGQQWSDDAPPF